MDDFVFLAFVLQLHQIFIVEGCLGVFVDIEVDFVTDFGNDIQLDVLVKVEVGGRLTGDGGIAAIVALDTEGQIDG